MTVDTGALKDMQAFRRRGGESWKPKEGGNIIRIIPFIHAGREYFYLHTARHWKLRPDTAAPVGCPRALFGEDCYVDNYISDALAEMTTPDDANWLKAISAQDCVVFNIIDRELEIKMTKAPVQRWWCPPGLGFDILDRIADEAKRPDFLSFEKGYDLHITKDKEARRMYTLDIIDRSSVAKVYQEEAKDLFLMVTAPSNEWFKAILNPDLRVGKELPDMGERNRVQVLGEPHENPGNWAGYISQEFIDSSEPVEVNVSEASSRGRATLADILKKRQGKKDFETSEVTREPVLDDDQILPECCGAPDNPGRYLPADPACSQCLASEYCEEFTPEPENSEEEEFNGIKSDPPFDTDQSSEARSVEIEEAKAADDRIEEKSIKDKKSVRGGRKTGEGSILDGIKKARQQAKKEKAEK